LAVLGALLAAEPSVRAADKDKWGTIKGKIRFDGKPPARKKIIGVRGPAIYDETWVVDPKTRGVRWTLIWLAPDPAKGKKTLPIPPDTAQEEKKLVVMDMTRTQFVPHVQAMTEGQTWVVRNSSANAQSVNYVGHPLFNKGATVIINAGKKVEVNLKAQKLPLTVNSVLQKWMRAYVAVFKHPYFAVTKADGSFEIKNAPVGTFRLFVWHEAIGYCGGEEGAKGEKITIKPGVNKLKDLKIKPD
jgi:hypothetical protein